MQSDCNSIHLPSFHHTHTHTHTCTCTHVHARTHTHTHTHTHTLRLSPKQEKAQMGLLCVILSVIMMKRGNITEGKKRKKPLLVPQPRPCPPPNSLLLPGRRLIVIKCFALLLQIYRAAVELPSEAGTVSRLQVSKTAVSCMYMYGYNIIDSHLQSFAFVVKCLSILAWISW